MGEGIAERALNSLGKGFDLTSDFRLKFCKGDERLVLLNETEKRELTVPGFGTIKDVSGDIKCDKGDCTRYQSDILTFNQVRHSFHQTLCGQSVKNEIENENVEIWLLGL
ncbi:hypothetical protein V8G54_003902 [Vigna mungo]|uniref:Uncharacterized protein n=1 Tax=Vigna mungo TaxID=3915 RepID=A0AAQ3PEW7_VIGMU